MYKFYLDNIEVDEPLNWKDIKFQLEMDADYWSYHRVASIEEINLIGDVAKKVKYIYDNNFNPVTSYKITKKNTLGKFNLYQDCIIDYNTYKEEWENGSLTVSIGLIDSSSQSKLRDRESNTLVIGNNISFEGGSILGSDLIEFKALSKNLRFDSSWYWKEDLQKIDPNSANCGDNQPTLNPGGTGAYGKLLGLHIDEDNTNLAQTVFTELVDWNLNNKTTPESDFFIGVGQQAIDRNYFLDLKIDFSCVFSHQNYYEFNGNIIPENHRTYTLTLQLIEAQYSEYHGSFILPTSISLSKFRNHYS